MKLDLEEKIMACACGHSEEEHGHDPKYPRSTACTADGCDCIAFEEGDDDEEV